ncbi:MAG: PLP-dependent aminotransferase family protein, partial [Streptosporangiaceae bacterium]
LPAADRLVRRSPPGVPPIDLFPATLWAALTSRRLRLSGERTLLGAARSGYRPLREAIAAYLGITRGVHCSAEQIIVTQGIGAGLELLSRALLDQGDQVWCEEPGYPGIKQALAWNGVLPCPVPVDAEGMDIAAAVDAAPEARMAVVSPARQLPMGIPMSTRRRERLLEHACQSGMWVIEHENDGAFLGAEAPPPLLADDPHGRVIYVGTFNTLLFPQLHLGFCVLPGELAELGGQVLSVCPYGASAVTQAVLADFLDDHRSARILGRLRTATARRREAVRSALTRLPGAGQAVLGATGSGSYLTLSLPAAVDESALVTAAARASLQVRPLSWYFSGKPARPGVVLGCASVRDAAIEPSVQALGALLPTAETLLGTEG